MSLPPAEPLYEDLVALRAAEDPTAPGEDRRWRRIAAWLEAAFPGDGARADARQETLLALVRAVGEMRAEAPRQAAKWVSTIYHRKRIDRARASARDPVDRALRAERPDPEGADGLARLPAPGGPPRSARAFEAVLTLVLDRVQADLDGEVKNARKRALRMAQARAALLRVVVGADAERIEAALGLPEPVGKDRLYKWVERGRGVLLGVLERWAQTPDGVEHAEVLEALVLLLEERRADAGRPRPGRRKPPSGGEGACGAGRPAGRTGGA